MFENLSEKIASAFKQIKGEGRISDLNVANTVKDIRKALLGCRRQLQDCQRIY